MSRRKHKRKQEKVELNLAAMLDMAFQLLTFFIFASGRSREGQLGLRPSKPEPVAMMKEEQQAKSDTNNTNPVAGIETLISIPSNGGNIDGILCIGSVADGNNVGGQLHLDGWFKGQMDGGVFPFKRVILQVGSKLRYSELMRVVDTCIRQTLLDGSKLTKLGFVRTSKVAGMRRELDPRPTGLFRGYELTRLICRDPMLLGIIGLYCFQAVNPRPGPGSPGTAPRASDDSLRAAVSPEGSAVEEGRSSRFPEAKGRTAGPAIRRRSTPSRGSAGHPGPPRCWPPRRWRVTGGCSGGPGRSRRWSLRSGLGGIYSSRTSPRLPRRTAASWSG